MRTAAAAAAAAGGDHEKPVANQPNRRRRRRRSLLLLLLPIYYCVVLACNTRIVRRGGHVGRGATGCRWPVPMTLPQQTKKKNVLKISIRLGDVSLRNIGSEIRRLVSSPRPRGSCAHSLGGRFLLRSPSAHFHSASNFLPLRAYRLVLPGHDPYRVSNPSINAFRWNVFRSRRKIHFSAFRLDHGPHTIRSPAISFKKTRCLGEKGTTSWRRERPFPSSRATRTRTSLDRPSHTLGSVLTKQTAPLLTAHISFMKMTLQRTIKLRPIRQYRKTHFRFDCDSLYEFRHIFRAYLC